MEVASLGLSHLRQIELYPSPCWSILMISVIVCTHNRSASLKRTFEMFLRMPRSTGLQWELIVADNNSSDDTKKCVSVFSDLSGLDVRYVFEAKQGLSHARNAGLAAARGDIIAFTDDDVLPRSDWLTVISSEFSRYPGPGLIAGRVELADPSLLATSIRTYPSRKEFLCPSDAFNLFIGCNFAFRRSLLKRIGWFDENLGAGSRFKSSEDADFFYRAWKAGEKMFYEPTLFALHDHGRRSVQDRIALERGYVLGRGAFYAKHILRGDASVCRQMYWELANYLRPLREKSGVDWASFLLLWKGFFGYAVFGLFQNTRRPSGHT